MGHWNWGRIVASISASLAVAAVAYLLFWVLDWVPLDSGPAGTRFLFAALPVFWAGFVLALCIRDVPQWLDGAWLGCVLGFAGVLTLLSTNASGPGFSGLTVFGGVVIVVLSGVIGAAGAQFGALVTRPLARDRAGRADRRMRAWHVGTGVAVAAVVAGLAALLAQ